MHNASLNQNIAMLEGKCRLSRNNILLAIIFTLINIGLLFTDMDVMFLFSVTAPYIMVLAGIVNRLPLLFLVCIAGALVILGIFFLSWLFSKKNYKWLYVALVLFVLDTAYNIYFYVWNLNSLSTFDVIFHIYFIVYTIMGIIYGKRLVALKAQAQQAESAPVVSAEPKEPGLFAEETPTAPAPVADGSTPIRVADMTVKARILASTNQHGHEIIYRRVKRTNELVIDGNVYDEYTATMEVAHILVGKVDGHVVKAGHDGGVYSFIIVDDILVAKKIRWY